MVNREQPNWRTVASEWDAFRDWIIQKKGCERPYLQVYVEDAIEQWLDQDDMRRLEAKVERLEELYPDSLPRFSRAFYSIPDDYETALVTARIRRETLDEFRRVVDEETDYTSYGVALAKVLYQYRTGGRRERIEERIERLIDAFEAAEIEPDPALNPDSYDPDAQGIHYNDVELNKLDARTRQYQRYLICQQLDPDPDRNLPRRVIRKHVEEACGPTPANDDAFIDAIAETLQFVEHPRRSNLYIHESRVEDARAALADDADGQAGGLDTTPDETAETSHLAAIDRTSFDDLDPAEKLIKIRITIARQALRKYKRSGQRCHRVGYRFIRDDVFDGAPSSGYANNVMEDVAAPDLGYEYVVKHGEKRVSVNLDTLANAPTDIWPYVVQQVDGDTPTSKSESESEPEAESESDPESEPTDAEDEDEDDAALRAEVAEEMDALMAATSTSTT